MITTIDYRIYNTEEIKKDKSRGDYEIFIGEEHGLSFALMYNNRWMQHSKMDTAHLEFFALSDGWQKYTSTGDKSTFFSFNESGDHINNSNILDIFKDQLAQNGFNLDDPIQTNLF